MVGSYTPVTQLKAVVLPAPLGPISATISPRLISMLRSFTATTPPNCMVRWLIFSTLLAHFAGPLSALRAAQKIGKLSLAHHALAEEQHHHHDDHREHHQAEAVAQQRHLEGCRWM